MDRLDKIALQQLTNDHQEIQQIIYETLAKRPGICNVHGCQLPSNVSNGFCDEHRTKANRERDQAKASQFVLELIYNITTKNVQPFINNVLETRDSDTLRTNLAVLNGRPIEHDIFEEFEYSVKEKRYRSHKPHSAPRSVHNRHKKY